MTPERQTQLLSNFPEFFEGYRTDPKTSCMYWGFECGDGWYDLLTTVCIGIKYYLKSIHNFVEIFKIGFIADQVKEKFGTLRFYYHLIYDSETPEDIIRPFEDYVTNLIHVAELASYHICEACGAWSKTRGEGWVVNLCDDHYKLYAKERGIKISEEETDLES